MTKLTECTKVVEIREATLLSQQALKQTDHIYKQLEELRNTLQQLYYNAINCKDEHRRELMKVCQQLHDVQVEEVRQQKPQSNNTTSIQVNPVIDVGDKNLNSIRDSENPLTGGSSKRILLICLGAGITGAFVIQLVIMALKAMGKL